MKHHRIHILASAMASLCLAIPLSGAELTLEPVMAQPFRDNGVLQQKIQLPVWGASLPGAKVNVSFDGKSAATTADAEGRWRVLLEPLTAVPLKSVNDSPEGKTMTVVCAKDGKQATKEIRNLLVGDVWLCAGQSNMAGRMKTGKSAHHPGNSLETAQYPALRLLGEEEWLVCSPETAPVFGKVAFFFARRLQQDALIPVGLMVNAVGGSNIENWLNQAPDPIGKHYTELLEPLVGYGIQQASPMAKQGMLQRLALAIALEFNEGIDPPKDDDEAAGAKAIDPVKRYLHFEKAHADGELDPNFDRLTVWELRFVVSAPEPDEALGWGREMLRNYRPDHIYSDNEGWRYANLVNTDVRYGSIDVRNDRPELLGVQNILMNGGICGRRAFFARYICRAFGIPATARPSSGHGASARWSPQGWVVVLGPGWGSGTTSTRYRNDLDFLATTQARASGDEFLKVKRAQWIGDVMGEPRTHGEHGNKLAPAFWNGVALATQRRIIEDSKAVELDALGAELGEANGPNVAEGVLAKAITPEDLKITLVADGTITIPAAAHMQAGGGTEDAEEATNDVIAMKSFAGGMQVFLPRFLQQKPILVRGGSWRHEASLCESATRHWCGKRPKKSQDLRGVRLAVTPDGDQPPKELKLDLGNGVTMDFIYNPPGKFTMGGDRKAKEGDVLADSPKHEVTLTKGFYLGKYEVTQAQYQAITNKKPEESPEHPVDGVKPFTAMQFCDDISAKIGLEVRLPTEAEWEYAARAGTDTRWSFGDDPSKLGEYAWFKDNAGDKTHPVGQKKPNPWGFYDMYGNVAEFVRDDHQEDYYAQGPKVDPTGPSLGIHSSMQYTIDVPQAGDYTLTAKVVTSNVNQSIQLAFNDAESPVTIELPLTIGMWGESKPVTVTLKQGTNTLRFWRDQAPQYGVAVKEFTLKPMDK